MKFSINSLTKTGLAVCLGCMAVSNTYAERTLVTVQIENVAPLQATFQTPMWLGLHDGETFDTYNGNTPANSRPILGSRAMESICEDGSTALISADFTTLQPLGQQATVPGPNGPLAPGEVVEFSFEVDSLDPNTRYLSYASMAIPSNDFCISNGNPQAHPLFDARGNFIAQSFFVAGTEALDAGTEVNDEIPANTAFFGQTAPNTGVDEGGNIGTIGSDLPAIGFLPLGSGGVLDDIRFREADFLQAGYSFTKFTFTAEPIIEDIDFGITRLSSLNEVPPFVANSRGNFSAELTDNGQTLLMDTGLRIPNNVEITAVHFHLGAEDVNGPVVANILTDDTGFERINRRVSVLLSSITGDDLFGPLAGQPLSRLIAEMRAGNIYVNVHTERFPSGELRGQVIVD